MEDCRLEEGEIGAYDTDVMLSYIDDKIHKVLGRFTKYFEAGSPDENLGPMFGGYGSFLPTYELNTRASRPNTSPKVYDNNTCGSAKSIQLEGGDRKSGVSTRARIVTHEALPTSTLDTFPTKASSLHSSIAKDVDETHVAVLKIAKESSDDIQQKGSLKVRIKLGAIDFSTKNIFEIGKNIVEDNSLEGEALSWVAHVVPDESPNTIIQKMTTFPVKGSRLLPPLPHDLICLTREKTDVTDNRCSLSKQAASNIQKALPIETIVKEKKKDEKNFNDHEDPTKNSTLKNKRKNAQDSFRPCKKTKKEGMQNTEIDRMRDDSGAVKKAGPISVRGLPTEGKNKSEFFMKIMIEHTPVSLGGKPIKSRKSRKTNALNLMQNKKSDIEGGRQQIKKDSSTEVAINALDAPSSAKKDSSSQAASNVVKEATDIKHLADRLQNSVSNRESTELYLQAALKFLHGASLFESGITENSKNGEASIQVYRSTAKLCEFCAHEYEKCEDMGGAALAYKCMEVAYMRVGYVSQSSAVKDQHELHTTTKIDPLDESPLSYKSGVDNLNSAAINVLNAKGIVISKKLPNSRRILDYAQDSTFAMEASRKSKIALAAAKLSSERTEYKDWISSIKNIVDFDFHGVEGFIHSVRLAMEATTIL